MPKRYLVLFKVHWKDLEVGLLSICDRKHFGFEPASSQLKLRLVTLVLVDDYGKAYVEVVGANIYELFNGVLYIARLSVSCKLINDEHKAIGVACVVRP